MKIILALGLLAVLANAAPPMGMPPMMMPQMMMGMGGMIPPEALDMIKNLKPEDIKEAIVNMPPQMQDMLQGMGITKDQLDEAIKNMPEDLTPMLEDITKKLENPEVSDDEMVEGMKDNAVTALKDHIKSMGMDIKDDEDINSVVGKAREALTEQLKEEGIDISDPEALQAKMMAEMRRVTGAKPDESDEEVKIKVAKELLAELKEDGMDVDPENPVESINKIKNQVMEELKKMDIDVDDASFDMTNIPELMKKLVMSGKFGNPMHLMMTAMASFQSGPQEDQPQQQMMMMPPPMPGRGYQIAPRGYVHGAEDALYHVFGGDDEVMQHLMEVREGAMRGSLNEGALFDLMQDLLHYRLEARVLLTQNRILEEKLSATQMRHMPPYSSYGIRVVGCRHHM